MSPPPRFELIVFDMDGVLTDSSACHARAFADLWARVGVTAPPPYPAIAGRTTESVVREVTGPAAPAEADIRRWVTFKQERAREYLGATGGFADARPAVSRLAQAGLSLALGTGASRATTRMLLERAGLDQFFPVVVTAEDVREGKPAPDTFAAAIRLAGGDPSATLVVEDSRAGILAGIAAGAWVASVRSGEALAHVRFLGSFPDLAELVPVILEPVA